MLRTEAGGNVSKILTPGSRVAVLVRLLALEPLEAAARLLSMKFRWFAAILTLGLWLGLDAADINLTELKSMV